MTTPAGEAPAGRDGPAQRPARPRPDALGGRGAQPTAARSRSRPAASRGCAPSTRSPACAASCGSPRRSSVIPLVKRALPAARLPFQDPGVIAVAAGASLGGTLLRRRLRGAAARRPRRAIGFMPALFALRGGELAAYHGVEHKAIGAYEADDEDAADATKEHDRCGSHLVAPMLASNLAGTLLLRRAVERPARSPAARSRSPRRRSRSRCSPGASATPRRAPRGRSSGRASRSSGSSARASPTSASSRSAAPRWPRSCASRASRHA